MSEDPFENGWSGAVSQYIVDDLYSIDQSKVKPGDIVFDALTEKAYTFNEKMKAFQIAGNHGELDYIKSNPDKISHIFEHKLKAIEEFGKDKTEYIEKLRKLKDDLDLIIVKWV